MVHVVRGYGLQKFGDFGFGVPNCALKQLSVVPSNHGFGPRQNWLGASMSVCS